MPAGLEHLRCVSVEKGLRFFGGDAGTYRSALVQFVSMYANGLPCGGHVDADLESPSRRRLQLEVHSLAGVGAAIGALALQAEAERLDTGMRQAERPLVMSLVEELNQSLIRFCAELRSELKES